jgi:hypothetical protein
MRVISLVLLLNLVLGLFPTVPLSGAPQSTGEISWITFNVCDQADQMLTAPGGVPHMIPAQNHFQYFGLMSRIPRTGIATLTEYIVFPIELPPKYS